MNTKHSPRFGCLLRVFELLGVLVVLLLVLLLVGYLYQRSTASADFEQFPPPGQRVDVGGYSLHLYCTGQGSPTVIVDAGNGDFSLGWQGIQPEVAKTTRICTYDRAGYGWSDRSPQPRSAETFASELHTLLVNAGEAPPYVLVGHSLGGYTVRVFANRYQDEVTGMILVDAAHEDQESRLPPEYADLVRQQKNFFHLMTFMARFGILRLIGSASQGQDLAPAHVLKIPEEAQPAYLALMSHPGYFDATLAELNALDEIKTEMRSLDNLGDLPLVILTAGQTLEAAAMASIGFSGELDLEQIQQEWLVLQKNLAGLSSNSRHIVVEGSSHAIELDRPQVVIQAILEVVEIAR